LPLGGAAASAWALCPSKQRTSIRLKSKTATHGAGTRRVGRRVRAVVDSSQPRCTLDTHVSDRSARTRAVYHRQRWRNRTRT
jgi:hypothetical protein